MNRVAFAIAVAAVVIAGGFAARASEKPDPERFDAADEVVAPVSRDVTPSNISPGPAVSGPLHRIAVPPPPDPPPRWQRFFRPLIVEAGLFEFDGKRIRVAGIAALPADTKCAAAAGGDWPCGRKAVTALQRLVRGRAIECQLGKASSDPVVAPCRIGKTDLTLWLAANGWGKTDDQAAADSRTAADAARCAKKGLWRDTSPDAACDTASAKVSSGASPAP